MGIGDFCSYSFARHRRLDRLFLAALLKVPLVKAFFAIALGVAIAGVIMVCASYGLVGFLSFLA